MTRSHRSGSDEAGSPGGPAPGGPLTDRQKTFIRLIVVLVAIAGLSTRVGALTNWAWEAHGVGRQVVGSVVAMLGVNFDFAVLFPAGIISGWLVLFIADRTKVLQRWLAVAAFVGAGGWLVFVEQRWTELVAWEQFWYVFASGLVVGVLAGIVPHLWQNRTREFPAASIGLFIVTTGVCFVALTDVYLIGDSSMLAATAPIGPPPATIAGFAVDFISVAVFLGLFGWFLLYSEYRRIAMLGTSETTSLALIAGLLNHTQSEYNGEAKTNGPFLSNLYGPLAIGNQLGQRAVDKARDKTFELTYLPKTEPRRWVHISAALVEAGSLPEHVISEIASRVANPNPIRRAGSFLVTKLVPAQVIRRLQSKTGLLAAQIGQAEVLILATDIRDFDGYTDEGVTISQLAPSEGIKRFLSLCNRAGHEKRRIIVVAGAEKVLHLHGSENITDDGFAEFIKYQLLDVDDSVTVIPVSWTANTDDSDLIENISALRLELDH